MTRIAGIAQRHRALVVEDDAEALVEAQVALEPFAIDCVAATNKREALAALDRDEFCLMIVDLEIKAEPSDLKGSVVNGHEVVRHGRKKYPHRNVEHHHDVQIIVVSGHVKLGKESSEAWRSGCSEVVEKMSGPLALPQCIRECMDRSGRVDHTLCPALNARGRIGSKGGALSCLIEIHGHRDGRKRKAVVVVDGEETSLTEGSLMTLLRLMKWKLEKRKWLHPDTDFGARKKALGTHLVSRLGAELSGKLPRKIVTHKRAQGYMLADVVVVGWTNAPALKWLRNKPLSTLAEEVERLRLAAGAKAKKT